MNLIGMIRRNTGIWINLLSLMILHVDNSMILFNGLDLLVDNDLLLGNDKILFRGTGPLVVNDKIYISGHKLDDNAIVVRVNISIYIYIFKDWWFQRGGRGGLFGFQGQ
jgi:hypothetical protein